MIHKKFKECCAWFPLYIYCDRCLRLVVFKINDTRNLRYVIESSKFEYSACPIKLDNLLICVTQ